MLRNVTVQQPFEDADTLIVKAAIENALFYHTVTIVGEDFCVTAAHWSRLAGDGRIFFL